MTTELFREVDDINKGEWERWLNDRQWYIDHLVLEPFEPDYEAATVCLWHQERYGDFRDARTEEQEAYRRRARAIVGFAMNTGE
jgi:hypothetical protein